MAQPTTKTFRDDGKDDAQPLRKRIDTAANVFVLILNHNHHHVHDRAVVWVSCFVFFRVQFCVHVSCMHTRVPSMIFDQPSVQSLVCSTCCVCFFSEVNARHETPAKCDRDRQNPSTVVGPSQVATLFVSAHGDL